MVAISVVIPTHERREAVLRAIHSVLDQHTPPAQVVVIDDGSTDGTADAIDALGLDIVKVFWQENRGPSAARNAAIARCSSDVVAFLDSDNTWHPHHLDFVCELFRLHPDAALVATQRNYHFGDETPRDSRKRDMGSLLMLDAEGVAAISAVAARREALITAGGFDERLWYGEDIDLFLRLALAGPFVETAATTVEVASDPEGLKQRGLRTDGYAPLLELSAQNVLAALDSSSRPDVASLRRTAKARLELGRAVMELNVSEDPRAIAPHLRAAFSHAPELNRASGACFVGQLARLGGWQEPERRLALIAAAARAWPERGRPRSELFASATREAFVQRRWRDAFRLARGLCSPTGLGVVARMAYRRTPFGRPGRMAG